jgi:hypothetical protein
VIVLEEGKNSDSDKNRTIGVPEDLKGLSSKVPQHVIDHPECLLELLASAQVDDIDSASIMKLMDFYDKKVGTEACEVWY